MARHDKKPSALSKLGSFGRTRKDKQETMNAESTTGKTSDIGHTDSEKHVFSEQRRTPSTNVAVLSKDSAYDVAADILMTPGRDRRWALYTPSPLGKFVFTSKDRGDSPNRSPRSTEYITATRPEHAHQRANRSYNQVEAAEVAPPLLYLAVDPTWNASQGDATMYLVESPEDLYLFMADSPVSEAEEDMFPLAEGISSKADAGTRAALTLS